LVQVHVERRDGSRIHPTNQPKHRPADGGPHRAALAKGEVGIREKKTVPTLTDFISQRFEPWAEASTSAKTWLDYYRPGIRTIQRYKPLANLRLNEITSEKAADFAAWSYRKNKNRFSRVC
jgi:hypothetical protein